MCTFPRRFGLAALLVILAVATRLLPHQANFTAIGAVALVSGSYLGLTAAASVTVSAMLRSDIFLGFYGLPIMVSVYGSLLVTAAMGRWARPKHTLRWSRVGLGSLGGSVLFFLATNFSVWQYTALYPKTPAGLLHCYLAALPFFRNSLVGDLCYVGLIFGSLEAFRAWRRVKQKRFSLVRASGVAPTTTIGSSTVVGKSDFLV